MDSTEKLIAFLQTIRLTVDYVGGYRYIDQITDRLKVTRPELVTKNESCLVEIPSHQFKAWIEFQNSYQTPALPKEVKVLKPNFSIPALKTAAL